ncbi:unnamed protein product [Mytilus coruscus]|uniref:Helix-turn-helix domain-containing protein n=1 Tax=Mytilus coruscus TaxID=42192 RepID=A0A6J8DR94_MYTCO|nr:unnamed protein product [Mytilus coruscus]
MNYACTYLGEWEETLFQNSNLQPYSYWRYVDDIWGIWEHGLDELKTFHELSNNIHPRIQTEMRYLTDKIEFLDVFVNIENGELKKDLYTKSTDKQQYLHVSSSHPNSVKNAIPYGLGIRVKRIYSIEENYQIRREEIKTHRKQRDITIRQLKIN